MSINLERLDKWIEVLTEAKANKSFFIKEFHANQMKLRMSGAGLIKDQAKFRKKEFHGCPGGLLAISPHWSADGGKIGYMGDPIIASSSGRMLSPQESLSFWLGCSSITASTLIYGFVNDHMVNGLIVINSKHTFGNIWSKVTVDDALKLFDELKTKGEVEYLKRVRVNVAADPLTMEFMKNSILKALSETIDRLVTEQGVTP